MYAHTKNAKTANYLVVDPDPGPVDPLAVVVLVRGGLKGGGEEGLEALLLAVALVRVPLPEEEEVVGDPVGVAVALGGGAIRQSASCNENEAVFEKPETVWRPREKSFLSFGKTRRIFVV